MKTKLNGILTLLLALVVQVAFAQQTVTGKVTDTNGDPILGATVLVRGSSNATTTDFDGNYSIVAGPEDVLMISFSGYEPRRFPVGTKTTINTSLEASLEAVIVTSYRTSTVEKSSIAASTVTSETIENRPNASIVQTLEGQVAGLNIFTNSGQPGANSVVNLRGIGSINGNTEPLFLLDGAPIDEDNFRSLNPQDIAEVTVLKDSGATSIYGNRGANGVILITTRQGNYNSPLKIQASTILSYTSLQDNEYNIMNSQQLLGLERDRGVGRGNTLTDAEIAAAETTNWRDVFFRTGLTKNNTLSLTSGGAKSRQYSSFGYFDQEGILQDSDLKRFNFRNNLSGRSENDRFSYNFNNTMNYSVSNEPSNIGTGAINRNYILGAYQSVPYISPADYTNGAALLSPLAFVNTPLFLIDRLRTFKRQDEEMKLVGSAEFTYKLTDNITARSRTSYDYQNEIFATAEESQSFNALLFGGAQNPFAGTQAQQTSRQFTFNQLTSLSYDNTFAEKHTVSVGLYTEYFKAHFKGFGYNAQGIDPRTFAFQDGSGFLGAQVRNGALLFNDNGNANLLNSGLFSYFGSANYDYDTRYGVDVTVRRDASSRFSQTNRWGTFYAVSARWNISNEAFWGDDNPVDVLKLRGSYGITGNQNVDGGGYFSGVNLTQDLFATGRGYAGNNALFPTVFGVSNLRWETTRQYNLGVDFEAFERRLRGSVDVYYKDTEDLFQPSPISGAVGTGGYSLASNFGLLTNKGVDLELRYDIIDGATARDLNVQAFVVGNFNENIIRDLPVENGEVIGTGREGNRIGEIFTIRYAGVNPANGNLLFLDAEGNLTENPNNDTDRVWIGKSATPDMQGSFGLNVDYKGFYLQTQFQFATGIDRFDFDLASFQNINNLGQFNLSTDVFRAWTPDNRVTDIPSYDATNINTFGSTQFLRESDYLRLRFINVGYGFDKPTLDKLNLTNLRLFVNAENLVTFSKWRGFDAAGYLSGSRAYPTPRIISLGVEIGI